MIHYRTALEKTLLHSLSFLDAAATRVTTRSPRDPHLQRIRIVGGLLRGMTFSTARLERASFGLGAYEPHVVRAICAQVRPGMVAYDVGANAGYLTLVLAQRVGAQGRVFSFEADPKNVNALQANVRENGMRHVQVIPQAVSDHSGTVTFATFDYSLVSHIAHEGTPSDARKISVPALSLDDFVYGVRDASAPVVPAPQFIKIDVEGAEEQVLRGAARVIEQARPVIIAEIRGGRIWQGVSGFMQARGYEWQMLEGGWDMDADNLGDVLFTPGRKADA
jgi:FkbM family methyltransferase